MKKTIVVTAAIFLLSLHLMAQKNAEKQQSNAELFTEKSGSLFQRGFEPIGYVAKCKVELLHIKDLITGHSLNALRLEGTFNEKAAILDADEIDGLMTSIGIVKKSITAPAPSYYTEISYSSRSGFSAGAYFDKGKWSQYLKLEKYGSDSYIPLAGDDFDKLLALLQSAKSKM